ncbi:MAG: hypothetical protein COU83_02605 [Candidatus Portnoybacteria bacterium CG10_big_fil_rev_8_21_14_0_10_40_22]|uniref:Uncharacterized protein n=2 Tax=Candidatus Portnoyibacteriota TaxID=1817913 RepID=A0A2M8KFJ4_9BACT|nr:MAG: hypothetical protein COY09_01300 [Candidatus Portnoybacteria bacterium CG_4_10_14_0_2_um_filter_39_11]PJE58688.1 MAG: hypothetical protein COU83_02605 [Candidatus Portnoybacteria bacterium CG10_big_fil_rev_8_21_14_0_10_40_22]
MLYEKFKQLGKDSVIYTGGIIISKIIGLVLIPIYTRVFNVKDYGVLDIISISATMIVVITEMGLATALSIFYFKAENKTERKTFIFSNFIFSFLATTLLCGLVVIFSQSIVLALFKNAGYAKYLIIATLTIPFSIIVNFGCTLLRLSFKPIKYSYIILGNSLIGVLLSIYFVVIKGMGLMGALYGLLIANIIFSIIALYINRNSFNWRFSLAKLKIMLKVGLPLAPLGLLSWAIDSSGRYFLAHFRTMSDIGLFSIGFKFASVIVFITAAFRLAIAPFQLSVADKPQAKIIYAKTLTYYLSITFLIAAGLCVFGKEIVSFFTTPEYTNSYKVIPPLIFGFIMNGLYQIVGIGLLITKKTQYLTYAMAVGAGMSILFNFLLVPRWNILGVAIANLLAYGLGLMLIYIWNQKFYHINFERKKIVKIFLATITIIIIGLLTNCQSLILTLFIKSCLIIILSLIIYANLEPREKEKLRFIFRNIIYKTRNKFRFN